MDLEIGQSPERMEERHPFDVEDGRTEKTYKRLSLAVCLLALCFDPAYITSYITSFLVFISVPVISIVNISIGFVYLDDCPLEPLLPIWLIIQGALLMVGFALEKGSRCMLKKTSNESASPACTSLTSLSSPSIPIRLFAVITCLASCAWLTAGNLWAFRTRHLRETSDEECNITLLVTSLTMVVCADIFCALLPLLLAIQLLSHMSCFRRR